MFVRSFHASSIYLRRLASAFGPGSVAMTSNPRARYSAAQLAPMTPVPTIAIRRISLLYDILLFLCVDFCVSDSGEIPLRDEQRFLFRAVEFCGIDGPGQIGEKHPIAFEIESDSDSLHQMREQNVRCRMLDRKSTRLNSSHVSISYAVFCLKKNKNPYFVFFLLQKKTKNKHNNN